MARDPRYDILFEPVQIGPVTAPNRFMQAPHCNGMGRMYPDSMIAMRGMKAEGGWGIVATEQCDFHPTGDVTPFTETRLWGDMDVPYLAGMVNAVHKHGGLAAVELVHNGHDSGNIYSREVPIGPMHRPVSWRDHPVQARAMDLSDIRAYRRWHREAALRARDAGFDIVVVYAGHDGTMPSHFLSRRHNQRGDEYGGSLENRLRLYRELLEDTLDAVGDTMGVIARFAVDEMMGPDGLEWQHEGRDAIEMLAEVPHMWDVNVSNWENDSMTSRFAPEGYQEEYIAFVKQVTSKPVSTVGRYTSPDAMVSAIRRGLVDMICAARPSIADPFLPNKIKEGRIEDIRECIGCNICAAWNNISAPIRCTQNPTMGEEWRKGWHPEKIAPKSTDSHVLVVGAGPAGLEAAHQLGKRGYRVTLAEATAQAGGRVTRESAMPNLNAWARVRDYRMGQIAPMVNVELYLNSELSADQVLEFGADHVALATGATWRRDGIGRHIRNPIPGVVSSNSFSPDDIMDGKRPEKGSVVIFDDDHYYMGSMMAELLAGEGYQVSLVTPGLCVSSWTEHSLEQEHIEKRLVGLGVEILPRHSVLSLGSGGVQLENLVTGELLARSGALVPVTMRLPNDALYGALVADQKKLDAAGIKSLRRIGDCYGPATIAAAVYEGHRYARELDTEANPDGVPFKTVKYDLELGG
ncbi:Trimethylamine dehydrogenase [Roseovarius litorisediminis]|uniref:Trimethylamine dehydrogenase n=1 Tax=Roseovarius litorisediminis TaxID=1312363 RepID=A0A1Y5SW61_9RHOB|nr:NAD(P)-binding protein [Roseovarius litorisediminis]SLN49167.1 Trimethylamine dehydrogenase [Roseovarius litorisediminis]